MKKKSLRVRELIDYRAGICCLASDFLFLEEGLLNDIRRELVRCYRLGEKYLVCGLCRGPLCLKGGSEKSHKQRLHFFHLPSPESDECPLHLESQSSEDKMRAIIYDGVKESPCHREMKNTLGSILALDSSCHDIYVDELFKRRLPHERYKPDVQGYYLDKNIIFEIQISSDFITVIQSREEYYRNKNAYLLWIFNAFSTDFAQQTLAQKDIFYGNNRHAFCFTKECATLSYQHKVLHLQVFYQMPLIANGRIEFCSVPPQIITLHDIQFDSDFTAYFYDFKRKYEECQQELAAIAEREKQAIAKEALKTLLLLPYSELEKYIREKCGLNFEPTDAFSLIKYILSALKEKPTLIGGDNNKSLYRNTLNRNNKHVRKFFCFFHAVARDTSFYNEVSGDLLDKIEDTLAELREQKYKSDYYPDMRYEPVLKVFFPKTHKLFQNLMNELGLNEMMVAEVANKG